MILKILNEIAATAKSTEKLAILKKNKDNELLKDVVYRALSPRIKFYIKQIPSYDESINVEYSLSSSLLELNTISSRQQTGQMAIDNLRRLLECSSTNDAEVIKRIIRKDLRIGCNAKTINKVWPKLIEVTPYMGAITFDAKKAKKLFNTNYHCFSQTKMDGRYANLLVDEEGEVRLESRQGEETFLFGIFDNIPSAAKGYVFNGELTIPGVNRYTSNGMIASIVSIGKKKANGKDIGKELTAFEKKHGSFAHALNSIRYTAWDMIPLDSYYDGVYDHCYNIRFVDLNMMYDKLIENGYNSINLVESKQIATYEEAIEDFQEHLKKGEEGTILKGGDGFWKNGKPNWQIKMKLEFDCDLEIIGFNRGKEVTRFENTLGSLKCESSDGKLKTDPAAFTDEMRDEIWNNKDKYINTIVEVTCSGVSHDSEGNYSLLHPRFKKLRDDKQEADSLKTILNIEKMIMGLS